MSELGPDSVFPDEGHFFGITRLLVVEKGEGV